MTICGGMNDGECRALRSRTLILYALYNIVGYDATIIDDAQPSVPYVRQGVTRVSQC